MKSNKPFRIHLYKLNSGKKSTPLPELLDLINSEPLINRERTLGLQPYRLEEAIAPTTKDQYWLIDFSKRRYEGGPGKASKATPVTSFDMTGFQFAEETAAIYDPNTDYFIVQYNHHGPRATAIGEYFSVYDADGPNDYELLVQLAPDAQARLENKKIFTRLKIKVAPAKLSAAFRKNNVSFVDSLKSQIDQFGGDTVFIEIGINRDNKGSLNIQKRLSSLLKMANEETEAVSALVISGKDEANFPIDPVDLISEKLETKLNGMPLDNGLRYPKAARYDALKRAYIGWKKEKIIP